MNAQFQYHMISDRRLCRQSLPEIASKAEKSGIHYFQLREKDLAPPDLLALAREIRRHLRKVKFIVNGALDVALAAQADGIHLQRDNLPPKSIRSRYSELTIGYSAHSLEEMKQAEEQGADYVFISPIFSPRSKASPLTPHGLSNLASWTKQLRIPVFALGGISLKNLADVKQTGCAGVAGISLFLEDGHFAHRELVM